MGGKPAFERMKKGRAILTDALRAGGDDQQGRELPETRNIFAAVRTVRQGLANEKHLPPLPA